jgi:uncharacterized protein with PQ loop repeat
MNDQALMYTASALYIICYLPELYANYVNKNANIYNLPEKIIMLIASTLGLTYSIRINNTALMTNYGPLLTFDCISLVMRLYYWKINKPQSKLVIEDSVATIDDTFIELLRIE